VIDPQDFDALLLHPINSDIRERRKQKLSGSFLTSNAATMGPLFQGLNYSIHFAQGWLVVVGMVVFEVVANVL
jgi:hypothetical protein